MEKEQVDKCKKNSVEMEERQSSCEYYEKGTQWETKENRETTQKIIKRLRERG